MTTPDRIARLRQTARDYAAAVAHMPYAGISIEQAFLDGAEWQADALAQAEATVARLTAERDHWKQMTADSIKVGGTLEAENARLMAERAEEEKDLEKARDIILELMNQRDRLTAALQAIRDMLTCQAPHYQRAWRIAEQNLPPDILLSPPPPKAGR